MTAPPRPNLKETLALVARLRARGELIGAEAAARRLHAAYPRRAEACHALGDVLLGAGRPELAEEALRRAVESERNNAAYRLALGDCLLAMGRVVEADAQFERARALAPRNTAVNWRYGAYLLAIGRGGEALEVLDAAMATASPQERPRIHLEKIECLLSLGRPQEAEAEIRGNLAASPFRSRLVVLLSQASGAPDVDEFITRELGMPGLAPLARSDLMLRRGSLNARAGRHAEAFADWTAAKRLLSASPRGPDLGRMVDERIAAWPADRIASLAARYGTPGPAPVFVVGLPRSGTTLTSEILAAHSALGSAGEIETMTYVAARMRGQGPLAEIESALAEQGVEKVHGLAALYREAAQHLAGPGRRSVDKMPNNFLYLAEIAVLFPGARIIACTRHPADTFISAIQTEMNAAHAYTHDPGDFALYHRHHRRLMQHWHAALPGRIFDLSYEALVADPRAVVGDLLAFLGLPCEEACLSPGANASTVRTFSRLQVRSAIHAGSVGRWKPYAAWLGPLLNA